MSGYDDPINDEPLVPMQRRSIKEAQIKYALWGGLFLVSVVLIGLLSYQIVLTKSLANKDTVSNEYASLSNDITKSMDFSANPCSDFYQYSCGGFINSVHLPAGSPMYIPIFSTIESQNYNILYNIVTEQWPLISDLYSSCMGSANYLNNDTTYGLLSLISTIQSLQSPAPQNLLPLLGSLHRQGIEAFFVPQQQDNIFQAGSLISLLLTDATLPVDLSTPASVSNLASIIYRVVGSLITFTPSRAQNVAELEAALFSITESPDSFAAMLVNMTWSNFLAISNLDYSLYTSSFNLKVNSGDTVIIATPGYFANLSTVLDQTPQQTIIDYLIWRTILSMTQFPIVQGASLWKSDIKEELLKMESLVSKKASRSGIKRQSVVDFGLLREHLAATGPFTNQQLDCIDTVDQLLGDFLGLIFTMKVVDDDVIDAIHTVTGGVQSSFKNSLADLTWIDQPSKNQAVYKLSNILQIIGHPNKLDRYRGLLLDPNHFLSNIIAINQRVFDDGMANVGQVFDRADAEFPATIVNAFYSPDTNTINFPAGILESPMFSTDFPAILQYARMGYVIGHETTHGFDNNGRMWNAQGVYQQIMDSTSSDAFEIQAQCIVDQFNNFEPIPGYYVNGQQTLGENIADLGGLKNAYRAYKAWTLANGTASLQFSAPSPLLPSLTNEQVFFVLFGQTWCTKASDDNIKAQLIRDVHAPSQYRVNGPLANIAEFSKAFNCPANSPMNPTNKCLVW